MKPQVGFALVFVLLGSACAQECVFTERVNVRPGPMTSASALERVRMADEDSCRARCCAIPSCDTAALEHVDGVEQCHLFRCDGTCTFVEGSGGTSRVFTRSGGGAPSLQVGPMILGTRTKDKINNNTFRSGVCSLPPVVGMCKAALRRFHFDTASETCQSFIYGGCGGNGNNFEKKEECETTCVRAAAEQIKEMEEDKFRELCTAPPLVGPCRASFPRWFFNSSRGRCDKFTYGGCKGNKNNHESEETCASLCSGVKVLPSRKKVVPVFSDDDKGPCSSAPDAGPCRAAFPMFFYDHETQDCRTFTYGGCKGNENRFKNREECVSRCISGTTSEGRGQERHSWTAAFFLFLALAGVSFLLLSALIFITLRRYRVPRRALSIRSDKEELLPESESSSVDSLPLPETPNVP